MSKSNHPIKHLSDGLAAGQRRRRGQRRDRVALEDAAKASAGRNDLAGWLRLEDRPLDALDPGDRRLLKADERRIAKAVRLASHIGWIPPLLVSEAGAILGDPLSYDVAKAMEMPDIACVIVPGEMGPTDIKLIATALAQQAASGVFDIEVLRSNLIEIKSAGIDLDLTGIELPQVDIIIGDRQTDPKLDACPEPETAVTSRMNDLWLLGQHLVLCGDATDPAAYIRLMAGKQATASIGDPPFNIAIEGHVSGKGKVKHQDFIMGVGEWTDDEFAAFLTRYLHASAAHVVAGGAIFAFMDWRSVHILVLAGKAAGLTHVNTCVWAKGGGAMGRPWRSAHELIPVFANGDRLLIDNIELGRHGRNRTNVFEYPGANRPGSSASKALALHSTPKSVEMIADAILDVTSRGDIVLDPFLGSGTTIIAADAVDRIGYGLELDPKYVDVIVRRWQEMSGKPAIHAEEGETFDSIAHKRQADGVVRKSP
ncbi:MAG: DNA-methyltransferase [Sphingosinicella sp.]|uniref:DNA-methyltransferase n=1 Tax=Sphingosinicella sp. TaxID=1917971 RepID=UPI00403769B3